MPSCSEKEMSSLIKNSSKLPQDRLNYVFAVFYFLGVASLVPWNFFTNAKEYFMYKLRNTTSTNLTYYYDPKNGVVDDWQVLFEGYLAIVAMVPNVLFIFLNTITTKLIPLSTRLVSAAVVIILMFILTTVLVKINTDTWQTGFFIVTMMVVVIMNASSAVMQGGLLGLASFFPSNYTQAVMMGMSMGGVLATIGNILAITFSSNPLSIGFSYFLTAAVVILLAVIGFLSLYLCNFAKYYMQDVSTSKSSKHRNYKSYDNLNDSGITDSLIESADHSDMSISLPDSTNKVVVSKPHKSTFFKVLSQLGRYGFSVFFVFFVTLACFPALNSNILSVQSGNVWSDTYFVPVTCFFIFNFGDFLGRTVVGWIKWPSERSVLLPLFSILRVIFIPLFMLCNIQPRKNLPLVFNNDIFPIILNILFSISNGYLSTLAMMYGPSRVEVEHTEMAGSMMSLLMSTGLGAGSILSFGLIKLI